MRLALPLLLLACSQPQEEVVFADPDARWILGGADADIEDHPSLVSLQTPQGDAFCGGAVIDPLWVLTAAHCLDPLYFGQLVVESGASVHGEGTIHGVAAWIEHPDYHAGQKPYDLALLRMSTPIEDAPPLPLLTTAGEEVWATPGVLATVAGWGDMDNNGTTPDQLQAVQVPLVDFPTCEALYAPDPGREVLDTMVCAGDLIDGGEDACYGDSGGPLVVETDQGPALYGIVSWGAGCGEADRPGVYTRVPSFVNWIQHEVWGSELDDFGNSVGDAEPVPVNGDLSVDGSFLADDIDTFALWTTERHQVDVTTTSGLDIHGTVVRSDGTVLAASSGTGDVSLTFELDGEATLELQGPEGDYALEITSTSLVPEDSGSGCGSSSLWAAPMRALQRR